MNADECAQASSSISEGLHGVYIPFSRSDIIIEVFRSILKFNYYIIIPRFVCSYSRISCYIFIGLHVFTLVKFNSIAFVNTILLFHFPEIILLHIRINEPVQSESIVCQDLHGVHITSSGADITINVF